MANTPNKDIVGFDNLKHYDEKIKPYIKNQIPTKTSQLTNDSNYATKSELTEAIDTPVSYITKFPDDESILVEYQNGKSEKTVFNDDGSITVQHFKGEQLVRTEKTIFNKDGSISVTVS